jgi:predicted ABC-type ATPase
MESKFCVVQPSEQAQIVESLFRGKRAPRPVFAFVYGLPGAGKTSIIERFLHEYGLLPETVVRLVVDDVVHQLTGFKAEIDATSDRDERRAIYSKYRACADRVQEAALYRALAEGFNVVYETTGASISSKLREVDVAKRRGYYTVLLYPFITPALSKERIRARPAQVSGATDAYIDDAFQSAQRNLVGTWANVVDEIIVYDNSVAGSATTAPVVLRYKRVIDAQGRAAIERICGECRSAVYEHAVSEFRDWLHLQCPVCNGGNVPAS